MATLDGEIILESGLTTTQLVFTVRVSLLVQFFQHFTAATFQGGTDSPKWIASTDIMKDRLFLSERIVVRECYDHLLPIVEAKLEEGNVSVEGTPGIGKTVFGFFLLRRFLKKRRSTVYWDGNQATLLTKEEKYIELFGLKQTCDLLGEEWHWGAWLPTSDDLQELLLFEDIYVIHDPAEGFKHRVQNYMRKAMHTALKEALPSAQLDMSVTTFCVPTACFHSFLFQPEEGKDSHQPVAAGDQAEFQFVIEIPDNMFTQLPASTEAIDTIHGKRPSPRIYAS